jgi:hypothetical protein
MVSVVGRRDVRLPGQGARGLSACLEGRLWLDYSHNATPSHVSPGSSSEGLLRSYTALTVGKKPSVNTLSKLVLPQAPSPMMTSFLDRGARQRCWIGARYWASTSSPSSGRSILGELDGPGGRLTCG